MGKVKSFPKVVELVSHRGSFKVRSLTSEPMLLTSKVRRALSLCQRQESLQPSKVQSLSKLLAQHGANGSSRTAGAMSRREQPLRTLRSTASKGKPERSGPGKELRRRTSLACQHGGG